MKMKTKTSTVPKPVCTQQNTYKLKWILFFCCCFVGEQSVWRLLFSRQSQKGKDEQPPLPFSKKNHIKLKLKYNILICLVSVCVRVHLFVFLGWVSREILSKKTWFLNNIHRKWFTFRTEKVWVLRARANAKKYMEKENRMKWNFNAHLI